MMASYQNKKSELARRRFLEMFGNLSEESQLNLIEKLSKIETVVRL